MQKERKKLKLTPLFQPIFGADRKSAVAWEGLIRGPEASLFENPMTLFATASRSGLLTRIEWESFSLLCRTFVANDPGGKLFLNLYPETLLTDEFSTEKLRKFFSDIGLCSQRIVIEMTEHAIVRNNESLLKRIKSIRELGVAFAIDDFGTGFNNFSRWVELTPEYIKFDQSLILGIHADQHKQVLVEAFFSAARGINTFVVIEGVENQLDADWLDQSLTYFPPFVQGFLYGKPQSLSEANECSTKLSA